VELRNKPHDIPLQLQPEILKESKINTIGTWTFKTIAVPDRRLNLLLRKRFGKTATLGKRLEDYSIK
jgi:hypothetical protein